MLGRATGSALVLLLLLGLGLGAQEEDKPARRPSRAISSPYRILRVQVPESAGGLRVAGSTGSALANFGSREAVQPGSVFRVMDAGLSAGLVRVEQVWYDSSRVRLIQLDRKPDPSAPYPLQPGYFLLPELVFLETVRFDSTGLQLPLDVQERLRTAVRFVRAVPEFPVHLEAHADAPPKKKGAAPAARPATAKSAQPARRGKPAAAATNAEALPLRMVRAGELRTHLHEVYRVPLEQLHTADLGSSRPIGNSATAAGRRLNHRIEIVVHAQALAPPDTTPQMQLEDLLRQLTR